MSYKLEDLIELVYLQDLLKKLNAIYSFTSAVVDNEGKILSSVGWQDICIKFHRNNPVCEKECIKSDQYILNHIHEANPALVYKCPHGLVDSATPIIINGMHLGNFFTGQFFYENPDLGFFSKQAKKYGFDEEAYLEAVKKVPVWTKEKLGLYHDLIKGFIEILAGIGIKNLREIEIVQSLKESEEHNRKIIENSLAGYFYVDTCGIFRKVNSAWLKMHKYASEEEVIGQHFGLTQVASDAEDAQQLVENMLNGDVKSTGEFSRLCRDGSIGYHTFSFNLVYKDEKVIGLEGFLIDTTESKLADIVLKKSEEKYRNLFQNMITGFALHEIILNDAGEPIDYKFLEVNPAFEKLTGLNAAELIGRTSREVLPDSESYWIETYGKVALSGKSVQFENYSRSLDRYYEVVAYSPEPKMFATFFIDITKRNQYAISLLKSEEKHRRIIETTSEGYWMINETGNFIDVNEAYLKIIGYTREELLTMSVSDLEAVENKSETELHIRKIFRNGYDHFETIHRSKDGRLINLEVNASHIVIAGSRVVAFVHDITNRKNNDKALKESEEKYRLLISNISDVIYSVDMQTQEFKYLSPSFQKITGYSFDDVRKMGGRKKFLNTVVDLKKYYEWDNFLEQKNEPAFSEDFNYETKWLCKNGTYKYLLDHWIPIFKNGVLDSTYGILTDITARKQSEFAREQQNDAILKLNRFAIGLSNLSFNDNLEGFITRHIKEISGADAVIYSEYNHKKRTISVKRIEIEGVILSKVIEILGTHVEGMQSTVTDEMYSGMTSELVVVFSKLYDACFGAVSRPVAGAIQALLKTDRFFGVSYILDGKLFGTSLLALSKEQPDPPREILENFIHLVAESLQRKKTEKALRDSEEKFRTLFEKASDGIFLMNLDNRIVLVNDSFAQMHGYTLNEMQDINLERLDTPQTYRAASGRIKRILGGETLYFEATHYHKLRHIITLDVIASMIILNGEQFLIGFHRDITDRKLAEKELKDKMEELTNLNNELEQYTYANQELKQFAYIASHQLQEPIRTVSNFTKIIEEDYSRLIDEKGLNYLHTIRDATARMATLINTLIEFSRLGRSKKLAKVDCRKLIDMVLADLEILIDNSGAVFEISTMPSIYLYEVEILQLFQNLITNAIKFRKNNVRPKIRIHSEKADGKWLFSVTDNGIGIASEHFDRIFDIFQRLHVSEEEFEGKGIGLAYCKKIVQMHQGRIWVESKIGEGSVFYFTLPY